MPVYVCGMFILFILVKLNLLIRFTFWKMHQINCEFELHTTFMNKAFTMYLYTTFLVFM